MPESGPGPRVSVDGARADRSPCAPDRLGRAEAGDARGNPVEQRAGDTTDIVQRIGIGGAANRQRHRFGRPHDHAAVRPVVNSDPKAAKAHITDRF